MGALESKSFAQAGSCKAAGKQSIVWEVRNNSQPNNNMWNNVLVTEEGLFIQVR